MDERRKGLSSLLDQAEAIAQKAADESRKLTDDERSEYDRLIGDHDELLADIERSESLENRRHNLADSVTPPPKPEPRVELVQDEADKTNAPLGEFLQAVALRCGYEGRVNNRAKIEKRATGLSEGVPADGGFLVDTDMAEGLFERTMQTAMLPSRCRNLSISSNANSIKINAIDESSRADGSRWGGILAYWKNEAAQKTASDPKFRQMELSLHKLVGLCYATDELLEDARALEAVLRAGFEEEFGFKLDDAIVNGDGAGKPLGIMNAPCLVTASSETGQAAATVVAENIENMYSRLWARSIPNAVWLINQNVWPQLFQLHHAVGTGGVSMFVPAGGLADAPAGTLLGRPIIPIEQCQSLGTSGDIILADFTQYVMARKGGIASASSIHLKFDYDETVFRFVMRVDGQPAWSSALTPFKGGSSYTQSPFVALETRS